MSQIKRSVTCLGLLLLAASAVAQDAGETTLACTNAGSTYAIGEFACIAACHQQRRLARCDAISDRASWTYVSEACPSAMIINPPWPSDWNEVPVDTVMSPIPVTVTYSAFPPDMPLTLAILTN